MVGIDDFIGDVGPIIRSDVLSEFLLPFILIFAIIFAILQSTKILGAKKNIDAIIALVFGLLFLRNERVVDFVNRFLPNIAIALLVILAVLLVGGMIMGKEMKFGKNFKAWAIVFAIVLVIVIFRQDFFGFGGIVSSETKGLIAFVVILIAIVGFLTGGDDEGDSKERGLQEFIFGKEN